MVGGGLSLEVPAGLIPDCIDRCRFHALLRVRRVSTLAVEGKPLMGWEGSAESIRRRSSTEWILHTVEFRVQGALNRSMKAALHKIRVTKNGVAQAVNCTTQWEHGVRQCR